jgi:hypothetical protein
MDLILLGYILPSIDEDLMLEHLDSYTKDIWNTVETKLFFKNTISDNILRKLKEYNINYNVGINEYWIPTVIDMLDDVNTKYVELFLEDKVILDVDHFIYSFDVLNENDIDYIPSCCFNYWNKLTKWISTYQEVQNTEGFALMRWGTKQSKIARDHVFRNEIPGLKGDPFPLSTSGVYKKSFLLKTLERILESEYWDVVKERGPNAFGDWAKNPYLPHSHEVWWKHNMDRVDLEYTVLIPEYIHSKMDDPKNENRFHLD